MGKNGAKGDVVDLAGREFKRVKNGLDEVQVASLISELINQRDTLLQRTDRLSSLTKLAEKTVTEADKLAEEMKTEAIDEAKTEAAAFIAKAEEQAQQLMEEKRTEIITIANEQAAAIKAEAERKAELLLENEKKRVKLELRNFVNGLYGQLLSELESLKQQVVALQVESEHKLPQLAEETSPVTMEADEIQADSQGLIQAINQTSTSEYEGKLEWEVEILPPLDIIKILEIVTYLDSLPEVENTELIPNTERPSVIVLLREPIDLIDMLRTLPEVAHVNEDATVAEGKPRKVQIGLSGETVPR